MHQFFYFSVLALQLGSSLASTGHGRNNCNTAVSVPGVWNVYGYLFNITVGNPPQVLPVLCDWTWMVMFLRSGRCEDQWNPSLCAGNSGQAYFDERQSSTFHNISLGQLTWLNTAYGPEVTVDYGADTLCIGHFCNQNTILQLSDFPYPASVIPVVPFAGIFGLAPVTPGLNRTFYPASYQAWRAGNLGPRIGWNSCATLSSSAPCLGGEVKLVFGGTDTTLYNTSEMQTYATQTPDWLAGAFFPESPARSNYWATRLTGMWVHGSQLSPNFAVPFTHGSTTEQPLAVLDEGSEGLGAPLSLKAYNWLVSQVGANAASTDTVNAILQQGTSGYNMANQSWYTVPCNNIESYPTLIYELDGRNKYTIMPQDYVLPLTSVPGTCYLSINVWKYGRIPSGDAKVILMGISFFKGLYVELDFKHSTFGFAPLRPQN